MSNILIKAEDGYLFEIFANGNDCITVNVIFDGRVIQHTSMPIEAAQALTKELRKSIAIAKGSRDAK